MPEGIENIDVTVENLKGSEANKAVSDALSNGDVKLLRKELVEGYYTPRVNNATAAETTVTVKTSDTVTVSGATIVKIPFKSQEKSVDAQITYRDNGSSERAFATVAGTASVLEEPMEILKENARYQATVENLEEQGYTVKEENATVVKVYTPADYASAPGCIEGDVWHTATITVKAVSGDNVKYVVSVICIDKGKVLALWDAWWCYPACLAACAGGCAAFCLLVAPALCWYCAGGCDAFCTVYCGP